MLLLMEMLIQILLAATYGSAVILQLLGNGSYDYDGTTGTASSSASILGDGSLTYSDGSYVWTLSSNASADALIVGGGGSGGGAGSSGAAGGGGGGTVETLSSYSVADSTNYTIIVGAWWSCCWTVSEW